MTTNSSATGEQPRATGTTGSPMFRRTAAETLYLFGKVFCRQDVGTSKMAILVMSFPSRVFVRGSATRG